MASMHPFICKCIINVLLSCYVYTYTYSTPNDTAPPATPANPDNPHHAPPLPRRKARLQLVRQGQ
eukprot:12155155-Alexandrium_andersonii.AAC.1